MTLVNYRNGKLARFSSAFDSKAKLLYCFYAFSFFIPGLFLLRMILDAYSFELIPFLLGVGAFGVCLFAAYRYFNKAVMSEQLFFNRQELQLIRKGLLRSSVRRFAIADVSHFRHLEKPDVSRHALAGETFDYLGFQTQDKVISELHGDRRLAFDWKGYTITFGENVYSWEFDELARYLFEITERDLREASQTVVDSDTVEHK